eukprot:2775594-Pyramimonas_sp.AAC.1
MVRDVIVLCMRLVRSRTAGLASLSETVLAAVSRMLCVGFRHNVAELPGDGVAPPRTVRRAQRASRIDASTAWSVCKLADEKGVPPWHILRLGDQNTFGNIDESRSKQWGRLRVYMSLEKVKDAFRGCKQLSISFDPSTYNGEETAVAVVYTSKTHAGSSAAGYCPIKVIPPNKQICAREIRMTPDVREIVIGRRQERWAAYKEGRALSSMISDITQAGGLESFCVPPQWVVRDIEPGESRMILNGVAYRLKVDAH